MIDRYYMIVSSESDSDEKVGDTFLKEITLTEAEKEQITEEARQWQMYRDVEGKEELYWHDNDVVDHSSVELLVDFYGDGIIVRDGHFYGSLITATDLISSGMSVTRFRKPGIVCIDGFRDGKTTEHESHSSDEVSWSHDTQYYFERKEQ